MEYYKLSGAGNDFLALVEPTAAPNAGEVRAWCRRGLSLGADGLFTLERRSDASGVPDGGGARMVYFNADGSHGELCLNGSRCAAALAFDLGWAEAEIRLATDAGTLRARETGPDRIALELPDVVGEPEAKTLDLDPDAFHGWLLRVGVPHVVIPWDQNLRYAPVEDLGELLRSHPDLGAGGANVNFVRYPFATRRRCEVRTFERGVEAETLACGTGVVATVATGVARGELTTPVVVLTAGGHELVVHGGPGQDTPWVLEGDARVLARGELLDGASAVPALPEWS